jgi:hypothetical protein
MAHCTRASWKCLLDTSPWTGATQSGHVCMSVGGLIGGVKTIVALSVNLNARILLAMVFSPNFGPSQRTKTASH